MTYFISEISEGILLAIKGHTIFRIICPEAWPASATLTSNTALKWWPCRGPPPPQAPCVLRSALFCCRLLLQNVILLYQKCFSGECLVANTITNRQKCAWTYFDIVANKGLIWTMITTSRIHLFAAVIFLQIKLCNMHRVYCLNYILNEWEGKFKNTYFLIQYCNTMNS